MTCPKFIGGDYELSTSGATEAGVMVDAWQATRMVLDQIDAVFSARGGCVWSHKRATAGETGLYYRGESASPLSTDCLRHWASNGQAFYSDMAHVEACSAESLDARVYAAGTLAALLAVEAARRQAEQEDATGVKLSLSTHNADWRNPSISSGTHFNVCVTRSLWDELFREVNRPAVLGAVASGMAAAIVFFGAGYLLPLADGSTIYSLSARAHHLRKLTTLNTTEAFKRGILNSRDEPHARAAETARMHLIGFDLGPVSLALRCALVQCLLAAAEIGFCGLNLFDPVKALRSWSWGLDPRSGRLTSTALLADGRNLTLPQYMKELAEMLLALVEQGLITESTVPAASDLLSRVIELAGRCEAGELAACARHLDWAAKLLVLVDLCRGANVRLGDAVTRLADQDYGNTDPEVGLFWRLWQDGAVDPLVSHAAAIDLLDDGPAETRAWARGRLIRHFAASVISDVNWSHVELRRAPGRWSPRLKIDMPRLDSLNRREFEPMLSAAASVAELELLLEEKFVGGAGRSDPLMEIETSVLNVEMS